MLTRCIAQQLGFSKGRPVAACIIYKCLRKWRSFEVEKTSIFYRIIQAIGRAIEVQFINQTGVGGNFDLLHMNWSIWVCLSQTDQMGQINIIS